MDRGSSAKALPFGSEAVAAIPSVRVGVRNVQLRSDGHFRRHVSIMVYAVPLLFLAAREIYFWGLAQK